MNVVAEMGKPGTGLNTAVAKLWMALSKGTEAKATKLENVRKFMELVFFKFNPTSYA